MRLANAINVAAAEQAARRAARTHDGAARAALCEQYSALAAALAELAGCILRDAKRVLPVSVLLDGEYGQRGVHCGVPCRIGKNGIEEIVQLDLNDEEQRMLDASCQVIRKHIAMAAAL